MASPSWVSTHQCTHTFTLQQFTRLCSHLASHAGLFRGVRIWPLLKNACLTENNISHSFIRVVSDQSTVLSLTFIKGHKAFLVFHENRSIPGSGGCSMISVAILEDGCKSYNYRIPWLPQLLLQILIACSSRFIAINRWIILLKSGNQNIKFFFNHPQFLKRRPTVISPQSTVILLWKPNETNFWSIMYIGCELFIALT